MGGKSEKKEVKIASRREVQKKGDFSESVVLFKEKLAFSRSGAEKSKEKLEIFKLTPEGAKKRISASFC